MTTSTKAVGLQVRPTDNAVFVFGYNFASIALGYSLLSIIKITTADVMTSNDITMPGLISATNSFKHVIVQGDYIGGCYELNDGTYGIGYFYYNDATGVTIGHA